MASDGDVASASGCGIGMGDVASVSGWGLLDGRTRYIASLLLGRLWAGEFVEGDGGGGGYVEGVDAVGHGDFGDEVGGGDYALA